MINFKDCIMPNYSDLGYMYIKAFGSIPSKYVRTLPTGVQIDFSKLDKEKLKEYYPNMDIAKVTIKANHIQTSALDNLDYVDEDENDNSIYIFGNRHDEELTIIDEPHKIFYRVANYGLIIYYDDLCYTEKEVETLYDKFVSVVPTKKVNIAKPSTVKLVAMNDGDYYTIDSKISNIKVDIDKNYNDDFKSVYNDITKFISDKERKSGLIVLNGVPGTGKSMFIRHIINTIPGNYILVTPGIAANMASPEFISFLMEHIDSTFILEDCENVIMDRESNTFANAVSSLLNMSDGIMSDVFNAKFICTFNADITKIDKAILRKGRCYANYEFKKLNADKVKNILNEKGIELDKYEDMTLAEVYHYEDNYKDMSNNQTKIGFGLKR